MQKKIAVRNVLKLTANRNNFDYKIVKFSYSLHVLVLFFIFFCFVLLHVLFFSLHNKNLSFYYVLSLLVCQFKLKFLTRYQSINNKIDIIRRQFWCIIVTLCNFGAKLVWLQFFVHITELSIASQHTPIN